jgi:glycosyltransferase involved in cell wall biosynthesis
MPQLSVVIPVYNGEKTIRETIESILSQTFTDFELLIINDGSIDKTVEIIESFADPRIQIFSYKNAGLAASRNRGIDRATTDYIAFIDADDLWTPQKLYDQFQALQEHPEAAVAYSWTDYINDMGEVIYPGGHPTVNGDAYAHLLLVCFLENGSNPLIKKQALLEVEGFDESLPAAEDWDLYIRLAARYPFVGVPRSQVLYRVATNNMSSQVLRQESASLRVIEKAFSSAPESLQYLKPQSIANIYKYLTSKAFQPPLEPEKYTAASRFIENIIIHDPAFRNETELLASALLTISRLSLLTPQADRILIPEIQLSLNTKRFLDLIKLNPLPLISVILPVHNGEATIKQTIESVLDQYFIEFELIVINDGSNDATLDIIKDISDYRIKVFSYPQLGQCKSRNLGLDRALGEYIAFIDADDLWTRDKLSEQLQVLQKNPEVDVVYSWTDYIDESGEFLREGSRVNFQDNLQLYLLMTDFIETISNPLIRHQALRDVGGLDETLSAAEDWDLWLRLAETQHQFSCLPRVQVLHRITANSVSANAAKLEQESMTVLRRRFDRLPDSLGFLKPKSLGNLYRSLTERALQPPLRPENYKAAATFINYIIENDPNAKTYTPLLSQAWVNAATFALLSKDTAQKLQQELKWVFDPTQLLKYNQQRPFEVSVILLANNSESTIQRTIESVLNQTFNDFELIVIDNASTDKTVEIVQNFPDDRIKLVSDPYSDSPKETLLDRLTCYNRGIDRSLGNYFVFLDGDEIWDAEHLSIKYKLATEYLQPRQVYFPKISVIIPIYNGESTIRETIESILNQTFTDFEIIAIDDGSTDRTVEVVRSIPDRRIKLFSYANGGQAASRNRGMERASGEYFAFIDADDLWTPDKLETQLKALEDHPDAGVAYSWVDYIDESNQYVRSGGRLKVNGDAYGHLLLTDFLENGSNPLVRREAIEKVGNFEETLPPSEDWDLWIRLAAAYNYVCVPHTQILYRISSTSQSSNVERVEASCLRVLDRAFSAEAAQKWQHLKAQSLANLYQYLTYKALENLHDRQRAKLASRFFKAIVENDPEFLKQKRLTLTVLLKTWTVSFLPPFMSDRLMPKISKLSYPSEMFTRIRPIPF